MSGRSAYVRKKNQDPAPSRTKSSSGSSRDSHSSASTGAEYPYATGPSVPVGTGIGTTNARLLKFSDSTADLDLATSPHSPRGGGGGWDAYYAHEQTLRTEDVSGIEKSGLRSVIDRKSDGVRKGIAKTFTFKKKGKEDKGKGREGQGLSSPEPSDASGEHVAVGGSGRRRGTYSDGTEYQGPGHGHGQGHYDSYGGGQPGYQPHSYPRQSQMSGHYQQQGQQYGQYQPPPLPGHSQQIHPGPPRSPGNPHPWDAITPLPSPPPLRELPALPTHQPRR
ncbi:uncharacterized protein DNG_04754 [Cephalotrichum gorgonifer]|uniref:Uncharacterized protein n=1 Tax=Cephalotrichum gorgonifer TaxID=2041049 RepID=A0AAE8MWN4_9PEZI|nr:uncharacterized protein DNG_04754 [Cephalotrichum gorgonifer]